ncbi:MAG: DUF1304 domain-containing protein [Patescibacteria group bacterium]
MDTATKLLIGIIAVGHIYFLWLEMFAWTSRGPKAFPKLNESFFKITKVLAANQGLYNGFLAAGLIWSLLIKNVAWSQNVATFFLICVVIAGIYGAITVERKILFAQTIPALIAVTLLII